MKHLGLIGYPVAHSLSPRMQQAALDAFSIEADYVLWETQPASVAKRIAALRSPDVLGANVTIPYKEDVVSLIDDCDPLAARIRAVNTIVNRNGRLVGYNTDAAGFTRALTEMTGVPCTGKKIVILGTGGAARAAAVGLLENEIAELTVLGRNGQHINNLLHHLQSLTNKKYGATRVYGALLGDPEVRGFLPAADLVVNATPVGLKADDSTLLLDVDLLPTTALVMDLIFNPPLTPLLHAARSRGCQVLNGLSMLLYQGALAFELWTERPAPIEVMRKALDLGKEG